mgnify:FL=1
MYDCIVVGGGPAGLTAAIYLKRACKKVAIFEREVFGGQITKTTEVENYPGFDRISGMELGNKMKAQAEDLGVECFYDEIIQIEKNGDVFQVITVDKTYESKTVIYAAGTSPRKLGIKEEEKFIGNGVSYCATCDGAFYKDKTVCVVGGGNTAIDDALYLSNICKKVYVIHRRDSFRAEPIKVSSLKEKDNIEFIYNATVEGVMGNDKVEALEIVVNDKKMEVKTDGVFVAIGSTPNTEILDNFVSLDANGYALSNHELETSVAGLFVAGDVRDKQVKQLTTATSDGTVAATFAIDYLNTL